MSGRWVDEAFEHQRAIDPFGHRVHTLLACLACFCVGGPTSAAEIGAIPLACAFLIRAHRHWGTWPRFLLQPLVLLVLSWTVLGLASLAWTDGTRGAWLDEWGSARFALVALFLWPVADRRALLLFALGAGFALGQCSQVLHAIGRAFEIDWMTWNRLPGRNSGWWDPVVGGSLLTAVLGLHLPAALWGRGGWRVAGSVGALVTLLGIVATGTRGAWLASIGLLAVAVVCAAARVRPRSRAIRVGAAVAIGAALVGGIGWAVMGESVRERLGSARAEIAGAVERREFGSDTGARLLMNWWAIEAMRERPLGGVGLGGYEAWTRGHVAAQEIDPSTRRFHGHAHDALLQAGATLGLPGLALGVAFALVAIGGAVGRQPGDGPPGYAEGPCLALVGLLLVSAFDSVQVNSHTAALLGVLLVFAVGTRPAAAAVSAPRRLRRG